MQVFPSDDNLYPESQTHLNDPSMLIHLPLSHIPFCPHSSMSTQNGPTAELENPSSQTHSKEPGTFSQRPFKQIRGFSAHSSKNLFNDNNTFLSMSMSNCDMFYIPTQECPDGERAYPSWHWHLKEPSMLMQIPWAHIPVSPHSSWSENKTKQTQIQQNKKHPPHSVAYPQCVCWVFIATMTTLAADVFGNLAKS